MSDANEGWQELNHPMPKGLTVRQMAVFAALRKLYTPLAEELAPRARHDAGQEIKAIGDYEAASMRGDLDARQQALDEALATAIARRRIKPNTAAGISALSHLSMDEQWQWYEKERAKGDGVHQAAIGTNGQDLSHEERASKQLEGYVPHPILAPNYLSGGSATSMYAGDAEDELMEDIPVLGSESMQ